MLYKISQQEIEQRRIRWTCCLCGYELKFHEKDEEHILFFAARHFSEIHGFTEEDMRTYAPELVSKTRETAGETRQYAP